MLSLPPIGRRKSPKRLRPGGGPLVTDGIDVETVDCVVDEDEDKEEEDKEFDDEGAGEIDEEVSEDIGSLD